MTSHFSALLRQLRRQAGMTQEQLAERSGVGVRTIRRLETGEPTDPRVGTVKLVADALDITPDQRRKLLSEAGDEPPPEDTDDAAAEDAAPVTSESVSRTEPDPGPRTRRQRSASRDVLAAAADQLAQVVSGRWQREEEQRRIHDPFPLPVRWLPMPAHLIDHWDNIGRVPAGATSGPLNLTGDLDQIADTYRQIPSGRLVVLGGAGSGKTVLALRFVLDYLRTRTSTDPVPVIFNLGSWDPTTTALRDWLIGQLLRDYPGLAASAPGRSTLAAALVEADRILPVLDGFDEIAGGLHRPALEALNATSLPLLLTSRPDEYARAVAATDVLTSAAGVELTDLTPIDLVNYLPRTARRTAPGEGRCTTGTVWDPVLDELREQPDSRASANLTTVLNTPLMVALARTVYSDAPGQDPAILLDTTRFPTPQVLEDHLLGNFVPTVYRHQPPRLPVNGRPRQRRTWDPEAVQRWLGYLARHLDRLGTHDLAWWQLGNSLRRSSRVLTVVVASALATAVVDWLFFLPLDMINFGVGFGLKAGLLDGLLVGPVVGLAFGLVYGLMVVCGVVFEPSGMQVRLFNRTRRTHGGLVRRCTIKFGAGLLGGFVVGLGYGPVSILLRGLLYGLPPGIGTGVVIKLALFEALGHGLVFGFAAGLEAPLDIGSAANPVGLLTTNRTTVVRQVLVLVPMFTLTIAFGGKLVVDLLQWTLGRPLSWPLTAGLVIGAVGGLSGGLSYALAFTAWGQWVLSRIWLPLTGRLPWAMLTFLDDAYQRGVLRQTGAVYQFRHARLQKHLSRAYQAQHTGHAPTPTDKMGNEVGQGCPQSTYDGPGLGGVQPPEHARIDSGTHLLNADLSE